MSDISALQTFVAAVHSGSFLAASKVLGISPVMVGRRIQALEKQYGATLIQRTTRAQHLTEAGLTLLPRAEAILDAMTELDNTMTAKPGQLAGRIRMTAPATLGMFSLSTTVARFRETHPAVTVEMILSDRRLDIVSDGFDFAVRIGDLQSSSLIARHVAEYRLTLVAAPSYLSKHGTPLSPGDLETASCLINLNMSPMYRWPFNRGGTTVAAEVSGGMQSDNGVALQYAAIEGAGIAYLPLHLVHDDLAAGRLVELLPDWEKLSQPIHFVYPSRHQTGRVSALLDAIGASLRTLP